MKIKVLIPAIIAITLLCLVAGCRGEVPTPTPTPLPTPRPGPQILIEVDATTDKGAYLPGEDIEIEFSFENVSSELFEIEPFPPLIEIMRPRPYESVRSFPAGTGTRSLNSGEVTSYTLTWDQRNNQGQSVPYGYYYLELGYVRFGERSMKLSFGKLVSLLILPAEGVMEKTIEVNESQTVNGITITLERVELFALEAKFYAFNVPPDYGLPQGPKLAPPRLMALHAWAQYSLDGGAMKDAGSSGIRFLEDGMKHTWDNLDPVPKGTKQLTFVITKLGDWEGPWEFQIPLQ